MKTQKGITLIALIITIIVMLILVGVSVSVALNTGLFKAAQGAAKNTEAAKVNETKLSSGMVTIIDEDGNEKEVPITSFGQIGNAGPKVGDYVTYTTEGGINTWRVLKTGETGVVLYGDLKSSTGETFSNAYYRLEEPTESEYFSLFTDEEFALGASFTHPSVIVESLTGKFLLSDWAGDTEVGYVFDSEKDVTREELIELDLNLNDIYSIHWEDNLDPGDWISARFEERNSFPYMFEMHLRNRGQHINYSKFET